MKNKDKIKSNQIYIFVSSTYKITYFKTYLYFIHVYNGWRRRPDEGGWERINKKKNEAGWERIIDEEWMK